jgi:hypothetical protein
MERLSWETESSQRVPVNIEPWLSAPLVAAALLGAAYLVLGGLWARDALRRPAVLVCPLVLIVLGACVFARPPGPLDGPVTTLDALRREPYGLLDHVGGDRPAALLLLAWPLAALLGERGAVAAVTLAILGVTALLVWALARTVDPTGRRALAAQAVFVLLALAVSGVREARAAPLVAQAAVALLFVHLARRLDVLDGARDAAAASMFFLVALAADAAGLLAQALMTLLLAGGERARGDWRRALRLLGAWGVAAALSLAVRYAAGLPLLGQAVAEPAPPVGVASQAVVLVLAVAGVALAAGDAPLLRVARAAFVTAAVLAGMSRMWGVELERARACYLAVPLAAVAATARSWRPRPLHTPAGPPRSPSAAS